MRNRALTFPCRVLRSPPFKFIVGQDAQCFTVPRAIAQGISRPFHVMMNNEHLKEGIEQQATIVDCEGEVFAAFCQFCFTGSYEVPKVTVGEEDVVQDPQTARQERSTGKEKL